MNNPGQIDTWSAVTDLTANVHRCVRATGNNTVGAMSGLAQVAVGVQLNKPASTTSAGIDVQSTGRVPVYVSGAIAVGVKVAPAANGAVRTAVTGDHVVGISRTSSNGTAAQPMIDIDLHIGGAPLA